MASGAGLNRIGTAGGVVLLTVSPTATANATPWSTYGNAGNDTMISSTQAPLMVEGMGFTKIAFQLVPQPGTTTADGYTITVYVTYDSRAYALWENSINPARYANRTGGIATLALPPQAWSKAPALSDQAPTGADTNPLIISSGAPAPLLAISRSAVAIRAVLTAVSGTQTGNAQLIATAVP